MNNAVSARRLLFIGAVAAAFGLVLHSQLGGASGFVILSFSMTLLGLLAALIGGVAWASEAPLVHLLLAGVSAGVAAFLLIVFGNINVHGPSVILIFLVLAGVAGSALILLVAAIRIAQRAWKR